MQQRHIISYVLFVLAVVFFVIFGPLGNNWTMAVILALASILVGVFFYRRGK